MAKTHRLSTTAALIVCLVGTQSNAMLFAGEKEPSGVTSSATASSVSESSSAAVDRLRVMLNAEGLTPNAPLGDSGGQAWHGRFHSRLTESGTFAQRRGGYWGRGGRHNGSATAMALGTVAMIAGGAILVYANRPDCRGNDMANGCGYGTKVVGGAVLTAGMVGLTVGALTW